MLKRLIGYSFLVMIFFLLVPSFANAYPGSTDSNGGHVCQTDCSKYGLKDDEYYYYQDGQVVKVLGMITGTAKTAVSKPTTSNFAYNDAVKQGELLNSKLFKYNEAINSGNIEKINALYDAFTKQLKQVESKIGKVPGSKNRAKLNETYVRPSKIAIERTIYEVSQLRLFNVVNNLIEQNKLNEAKAKLKVLDRLKKRAVDIKKIGGYKALPNKIDITLRKKENDLHILINDSDVDVSDKELEVDSIE